MDPRIFEVEIKLEHGHLREQLIKETDRLEMIRRLDAIFQLNGYNNDVRNGVMGILIDQFTDNDSHVPLILHTGAFNNEQQDLISWHCDLLQDEEFSVDVQKYPRRAGPGHDANPFTFHDNNQHGRRDKPVRANGYRDRDDALKTKFFKFEVRAGRDSVGKERVLDPCIICGR